MHQNPERWWLTLSSSGLSGAKYKMKNLSSTNPTRIQIFENANFGSVRTTRTQNGEVLFVAKDVVALLGYRNISKALADHVAEDDVTKRYPIVDSMGRRQMVNMINESGVYSLIFGSKLKSANDFKHWVTSEVLPQIRATGGYIPTRNLRTGEKLTDSEIIQRANSIMLRTIARRNQPADDCLTSTDVAKGLGIEVKDLNHYLVDKGVIRWTGGRYCMTPAYAEQGYDENRLFCYHGINGEAKQRSYLVWTPAGKRFIEKMFNQ